MLPKKYHAIAFLSILVMLLLLGLHLLGFGFLGGSSGGQAARSTTAAALARNSTSLGSSSSLLSPTGASSTLNPNAVYRHPIVYDKLTGATNNEINDVLGGPANKQDQYPLDHYQQQSQQAVRSQNPFDAQFNPGPHDPFANHLARQFGSGPHPPPPGHHHGLGRHPSLGPPPPPMGMGPHPPHAHQMPPPLPPPPPPPISHQQQQHMMTTKSPHNSQAANAASVADQRHSQQDSLPSASSVNNNGATRPLNSTTTIASQQPQYYQQQPQQPVYYTPPIFTYSNNNNNNNYDPAQQQQQQTSNNNNNNPYQPQVPPVGVPEVPLSVDEYNARQNRLRQLQSNNNYQHQQQPNDEKQPANLLADPQAQQRHKQQMLDRQLLFGPPPGYNHQNSNQLGYMQPPPPPPTPVDNYTAAAYYPDPALYGRLQQPGPQPPPPSNIRPPYAHQMQNGYPQAPQTQLEAPTQLAHSPQQLKQLAPAQNRVMTSQRPPERLIQSTQPPPPQQPRHQPLVASSVVRSGQQAPASTSGAGSVAASTRLALHEQPAPTCARQQQQVASSSLELANTTSQMPVVFCNEDSDYPTTEIMRALEQYAVDRSIELILPQQLVHMLTGSSRTGEANPKLTDLQRQLSLDSLQANINAQQVSSGSTHLARNHQTPDSDGSEQPLGIFPTSNYDSLCRSVTWMAQPRRAKNLSGQWKVVVNLPGHKFRGIAISQMIRVDECSRPNSECSIGPAAVLPTSQTTKEISMPARSRCLQHYDNQRLLAWSNQQGLHFDIFRVPIACSCHIRRF